MVSFAVTIVALALPLLAPWSFGPSTSAVQWLATMACCAWLMIVPGPGRVQRPSILSWGMLAFGAILLVRSLPSASAWAGLIAATVIAAIGIVVGRRASQDETRRWVIAICMAWLIAGVAQSLLGTIQYVGLANESRWWISSAHEGQAYGNWRQRNQFATALSVSLLAALWWLSSPLRPSGAWRSMLLLSMASQAGAIALSASRTGLLELLLAALLTVVWRGWRQTAVRHGVVAALAGYVVVNAAAASEWWPFNAGRLAIGRLGEDAGCSSRALLWSNVIELIGDRPMAGWGWGGLPMAHYQATYSGDRFCEILDNAHNLPLHLAVELGVPTALALLAIPAMIVWRARPWVESDPTRQLAWGVLALLALHSLVEYPLWYGPFLLVAGLAAGLLSWREDASDRSPRQAHPQPSVGRRERVVAWGGAAALALATCSVGWDYYRVSQIYMPVSARDEAYREDTLRKIQTGSLFRDQIRFAELVTVPLTVNNAAHVNQLAHQVLRFSPEPRVIELLIASALLSGRSSEAALEEQRFAKAFPTAHAQWRAGHQPHSR